MTPGDGAVRVSGETGDTNSSKGGALEIWAWGAGMAVAALAVPIVAVAIHQKKKRRTEKTAAFRKKEKIQL